MQGTQKIIQLSQGSSARGQLHGIVHFKSPSGYLNLAMIAVNSNWQEGFMYRYNLLLVTRALADRGFLNSCFA